jgi:hypothetical protein
MVMNILELKAADFGGAVAHVAASQLFQFLTEDGDDEDDDLNWYGSSDTSRTEQDVLAMARYINGRKIPAEQLWRWGAIEGILDAGLFVSATDLPLPRRMAFEIFNEVCAAAHHRLELAQLEQRKAEIAAKPVEQPGLKLEDSIFEPHGSLADQEEYQAQWLKDQAKLDEQLLEQQATQTSEQDPPAFSAGEPIAEDQDEPETPASISVGIQQGRSREKETADQGQGESGEAPADPGAQGDVSDLADDGGDGRSGVPAADEAAEAQQLGQAVAEQATSQGGGSADGAGTASGSVAEADAAPRDAEEGGDNQQRSRHADDGDDVGGDGGDGDGADLVKEPPAKSKKRAKPKSAN